MELRQCGKDSVKLSAIWSMAIFNPTAVHPANSLPETTSLILSDIVPHLGSRRNHKARVTIEMILSTKILKAVD